MRIVALLTFRNEALYLDRCLRHLVLQGIEVCCIDNGSTDRSREIAESFLGKGVVRIEHLPYRGSFELLPILQNEERLAREIDADWFIHHDADEIREAPQPYPTLHAGLEDADRQGYNAVNFDEFVFLPTGADEFYEGTNYVDTMRYYYFFSPGPLRRINAWKRTGRPITLSSSGGHRTEFEERKIFPVPFILRHYIFLSRAHALAKYAGRIFSRYEAEQLGWHGGRVSFRPEHLRYPLREQMKMVRSEGSWDRSDPWPAHQFLGEHNGTAPAAPEGAKSAASRSAGATPTRPPMPFIVGAGRSGTTLLRLMLDAHPAMAIPPETHFYPGLVKLTGEGSGLREAFHAAVTTANTWGDFHLDAGCFREELEGIEPFTIADGLRCFYAMYARRFRKARWGEKTPFYGRFMVTIQDVLPEAYFIHLIRDGRDVTLSIKDLWFSPGRDIDALAADWVWKVRETRQQAQGCKHYLEVRFEDLVLDTANVLKRICKFIELPYSASMEQYYRTAAERLDELSDHVVFNESIGVRKAHRLGIFASTQQPPLPDRIGRWRILMSEAEQRAFEAVAGTMLRDLGYPTAT